VDEHSSCIVATGVAVTQIGRNGKHGCEKCKFEGV